MVQPPRCKTAAVKARAGQHRMTITDLVSPHVSEVMLGIGFLKQGRAIWNFDAGEVILNGYRHKLCSRGSTTLVQAGNSTG